MPLDTPPVCAICNDEDPFCCGGGGGGELEPPDPAELLRREYHQVATALWNELNRHEQDHGCGGDRITCELDGALLRLWSETSGVAEALDFVLLGAVPYTYRCTGVATGWQGEYLPGPWRALPEARP